MSSKSPSDPEFEIELLDGITDALSGNVLSERESLAELGMEPDATGADEGHDFDWTPAKEAMQKLLTELGRLRTTAVGPFPERTKE